MADQRQAPIQMAYSSAGYGHLPQPLGIPWWLHELIYAGYHKLYGSGQTAERLAERGGFDTYEALTLLRDLGPDGIREALAPTEGEGE